jgi:hypothetical protein
MTTYKSILTLSFFTAFLFQLATGQDTASIDFYGKIKAYDIAKILTTKVFLAEDREDHKEKIEKPEPIGFIGDNFQRFYIHLTTVKKKSNNPYEYLVTGKTKVKTTICSFEGTIKILASRLYMEAELPKYKQGFTVCEVSLFEDKKQPSSGFIKGKMTSYFVIDDKKQFRYDGLNFVADGFSNNQFIGTWTSYKTNATKVCNWGDFRIPNSHGLDTGAGEFSVSDKYVQNGWTNYKLAWSDTREGKQAKLIEREKWWQ